MGATISWRHVSSSAGSSSSFAADALFLILSLCSGEIISTTYLFNNNNNDMSIVAMKRRAGATIGVSAGPEGRFSLQGNRRLPPTFVGRPGITTGPSCSPEDAMVPKRGGMSNAGMLASRFPKSAYTTANRPLADYTHQDYLDHIKRQRITLCPDPAGGVKEVAPPHGVDVQTGGSCITQLRSLERAWAMAASAAPNMPGKTGARDYSEWLASRVACSYQNDVYTLADIQTAQAIAAAARVAADAAERARVAAAAALEAAEQEFETASAELIAARAAYDDAVAAANAADAAADLAQAFLDGLMGTGIAA